MLLLLCSLFLLQTDSVPKSIVQIVSTRDGRDYIGAGAVIWTNRAGDLAYVLTARTVCPDDVTAVTVRAGDGRRYQAKIENRGVDLALLSFKPQSWRDRLIVADKLPMVDDDVVLATITDGKVTVIYLTTQGNDSIIARKPGLEPAGTPVLGMSGQLIGIVTGSTDGKTVCTNAVRLRQYLKESGVSIL